MARKYSSEYKNLQPYVVEDIRKVVTAAGAGGGNAGGSALEQHGLNSWYHTGELAQSQASWAATKLALSSHAADPNAHHAKLHAITDAANHSATGALQYQIVGIPTAGTLGYLTPKSAPAANEIVKTDGSSAVTLVDLTVTSDLFVTGYLDFGTDVMYEDASYLQVTGSKAVKFNQNIGNANWTVYNAGGASFGGSVDITGTGDLYVAGSLGGAGGVLKTSGNRVGIACVPDSQFALDVAGPARAQYFIGPHAIQLKDATMIMHFDGAAPYNTNYNGILLGHKGQPATASGGYTFRPGKFGKALQIAPATTNLVGYPSLENGTLGAMPDGWANAGVGTFVKSSDVSYYGSYSGKLTVTAQQGYPNVPIVGGVNLANAYTASAWVWIDSVTSGNLSLSIQRTDTLAILATVNADMSKRKQWQRVVVTYAGGGSGTPTARVLFGTSAAATMVAYIDGVQVEQLAYATPYCDGSLNPTGNTAHAWTGTAHASTSTRTAAALYYAIGNLDAREGTISTWLWVDGLFNYNRLFHGYNGANNFDYYTNSAGVAVFRYNSVATSAGTLTVRTWNHVAFTWSLDSGKATTYLNGVQVAQSNITGPATLDGTSFSLGSIWGAEQINGMIDDFAILSTAIDANQVRAIYESNAPVFAESSTVSWVATPSGLVWADERGLWMRDTTGNPVLGVYGGEAATYNWGGFDMSAGDLVLGRNAVGSSAIWWDKDNGKFGFYGAGSGTAQVEIATDGKLTAGAGKIKLDSAGFHAFNASAVATIDIDANGISTGDGGGRTTVGTWTSGSRIKWYTVGELYAATPETYLDDSSISRTLYPLVIRGIRQGNDAALVEISAVNTSNVGAFIRVGEGFRLKDYYGSPYNTNRMVHLSATDIILEATNLQLRSLTTSGTAVGSYSGKIRINISGTNYYIPYYAS